MTLRRDDDDDDLDDRGVVPDGGRVRVPAYLMDGAQRRAAEIIRRAYDDDDDGDDGDGDAPVIVDARGRAAGVEDGCHGYAFWREPSEASGKAAEARAKRIQRAADAWRGRERAPEKPLRLGDAAAMRAAADAAWERKRQRTADAWRAGK